MSRKDSKAMFTNILGEKAPSDVQNAQSAPASSSPHLRKVAAGIRQLQHREEMLDRLLKDETRILEIDSQDIAPSGIQDRFDGAYEDAAITELVASIRESGQVVPGLVRPISEGSHTYQIVFGRRRLAAAQQLGIPFRAIVKALSDEEAIVFQGEENSNREDLSFLERCFFAQAQEASGYKRDIICRSLSTSKSHLSEMLRLVSTVPRDTLLLIGRSPEIGRRRWLEFSDAWLARPDAERVVENALAGVLPEQRFPSALAALKHNPTELPSRNGERLEIRTGGKLLAVMAQSKSGAKLSFDKTIDPRFLQHLAELLPELHSKYMNETKKG